jgi:hypothetical protein
MVRSGKEAPNGAPKPVRSRAEIEVTLSTATEKLNGSVTALRMALEASDRAAGDLCMIKESTTSDEGFELRRRWVASSTLLHSALRSVERDREAVANAVRALLAL